MKSHNKHTLTIHILIGMGAGILVGLILNFIISRVSPDTAATIVQYGPDGLLKIMGQAFLSLLKVLVVPLVFVSLVTGSAALDDIAKLGRIGLRTMGLYLFTTAVAITLAIVAALIFKPGKGFGLNTDASFAASEAPSLVQVVIDIFPKNVIEAMAQGNMLQIIVFAILLGLALTMANEPGKRILSLFNDLNEVIMKFVWIIMLLAPYGVFALIAGTFAVQGFEAFVPLGKYVLVVLFVLLVHAAVTYPLLLKLLSGLSPLTFMKKMRDVQVFAFSTASSNATIPVSLSTVEKKLGVNNSIASFTVPLGATINMDGTAIMQGVATVFISQAYGLALGVPDFLLVILTATLASIGTAGVPGVGLIMLSMVLTQVGLPVEGIALIIGIDRILDMVRTAVNVTGDAAVSCIVAKRENEIDVDCFNADEEVS